MGLPTFKIALDQEQYAQVEARAKSSGFGDEALKEGLLPETDGVLLSYQVTTVAEGTAIITFTVMKKPALASLGMIQRGVMRAMGIG
jgi:hypothetical protein